MSSFELELEENTIYFDPHTLEIKQKVVALDDNFDKFYKYIPYVGKEKPFNDNDVKNLFKDAISKSESKILLLQKNFDLAKNALSYEKRNLTILKNKKERIVDKKIKIKREPKIKVVQEIQISMKKNKTNTDNSNNDEIKRDECVNEIKNLNSEIENTKKEVEVINENIDKNIDLIKKELIDCEKTKTELQETKKELINEKKSRFIIERKYSDLFTGKDGKKSKSKRVLQDYFPTSKTINEEGKKEYNFEGGYKIIFEKGDLIYKVYKNGKKPQIDTNTKFFIPPKDFDVTALNTLCVLNYKVCFDDDRNHDKLNINWT